MNKTDYYTQAMAYVKQKGLSDGEFPVIDRTADPEPWEAWRKYYVGRGMKFSARSMAKGGADRWTVPAKWPHEFDASIPSTETAT